MTKLTLTDIGSLQNESTAIAAFTANNTAIENAIENTISRDGSSPNQMNSNFDMNSKQILNLPVPATSTSPLRLQDLSDFIGTGVIASIPAGGTTGQVLAKSSNVDFATDWRNSVTSVGLALPADFTVTNSPVTTTGTLTGAWATSPTGTGAIVRATSPTLVTPTLTSATLTTPNIGVATGTSLILTSNSSSAFAVGPSGTTNSTLNVNSSVASAANGLNIVGAVTAGILQLNVTDPGADSSIQMNAKGAGSISFGGLSTGPITLFRATTLNNALTYGGVTLSNAVTGTGKMTLDTSPTLVTPVLGVATATSLNKVTITAPATSAVLTIPDGVTLTGPASSGTVMTLGNTETVTGVKTFGSAGAVGRLKVAGTTSGSTILDASATASGTLTLPAATDTLVGKATTDTLTNKTYDTAGTGNSFSINGVLANANTGTGSVVRATSPTLVTPALGTPTALVLTSATGLPISTGVSGLGTGNATALAVNVGTTGAFTTDTSTNTLTNKTIAATSNTLSIPYFSASLSTATQAMTTAVPAKILINSELADSNSWYDNATNYRFTPQLAGKYRITGYASGNSSGGTLTEIDITIRKNGTAYSEQFNVSAAVAALSIGISQIITFNGSTDYVELWAALYGTGTISVLGGTTPIRTWFEAQYVGA